MNKSISIFYYVAVDFVSLNFTQKMNLGIDLKLLKTADLYETDEERIEKIIFKRMKLSGKFEEFVKMVYKVKHEFKSS